jgi:hypothetical protein
LRLKARRASDIFLSVTRYHVKLKLASWLLAAAFLAIQAIAFAHEIKHDLHQHDSTCALHVYADHLGKAPTASTGFALVVLPDATFVSPDTVAIHASPAVGYHSRAPPLSSIVVVA